MPVVEMLSSVLMSVIIVTRLISVDVFAAAIESSNVIVKCCGDHFIVSDDLKDCVPMAIDQIDFEQRIAQEFTDFNGYITCFRDVKDTSITGNLTSNNWTSTIECIDVLANGSFVRLNCYTIKKKLTNDKCDPIFNLVSIYGAPMMIFANIMYIMIYLLVFIIYALNPKICRRAYDKVVLTFTMTQIALSAIIIFVGRNIMCHKLLSKTTYSVCGLMIMFFVISGCFLLLIISVDVASTITRIRWAPSSATKNHDENHKFRTYMLWVVIATIIPTAISAILEFSPLPEDHILKPQFNTIKGLNYKIVVHVATVPVLVGIVSNVLFIYTTAKMISIRRSSNFAHENRKNNIKQKYLLYLRLYLFMDAPYITGALGSSFENLWILKFSRLVQPILMLYAVLPRDMLIKMIPCKKKQISENDQANKKLKNTELF